MRVSSIFGILAITSPRSLVAWIEPTMESICRRLSAYAASSQVVEALSLSSALIARHVMPIALAGKTRPSLEVMSNPLSVLLEAHLSGDRGAAACRCLQAIISPLPSSAQQPVARINIVGLSADQSSNFDVSRRRFQASLPQLPCKPLRYGIDKGSKRLWLEVEAVNAALLYSAIVKGRNHLPEGWVVAVRISSHVSKGISSSSNSWMTLGAGMRKTTQCIFAC